MTKKSNKNVIITEITMGDDHCLRLTANNMNELINKIIEWQDWDNQKDFLPKKPIKEWYYYKNNL